MLFVFKQPVRLQFTMEKMKFPLDFIWIRDGKVIALTENVPYPGQEGESSVDIRHFTIKQKFDKVIELNAGEIEHCRVKIGDTIIFPAAEN
jgi:uncharacterized membrane protein (UPF0127 family)